MKQEVGRALMSLLPDVFPGEIAGASLKRRGGRTV